MHTSSLVLAALVAASALVLAVPTPDSHPVLQRRAPLPPLIAAGAVGLAGASIGIGAAAVHKNKDNRKILQAVDEEVQMLRSELASVRGTQHTAHTLHRRQIGTITSSVAIHRSKKLRKRMDELDHEIDQLEHDANGCLAAEGLHDDVAERHESEEHEEAAEDDEQPARRLERRQFGMILGPIATHKNKKDRTRLLAMQDRVTHIHHNVDRCKAAVNARMALRTRPVAFVAAAAHRPAIIASPAFGGGVMHAGDERHEPTYGRRNSYGRNVHVEVTHSHEHRYD